MNVKTYKETITFLQDFISPVKESFNSNLSSSLGFVLAEDIKAGIDLPLFNNSAMDGWAFNSKDIKADGFTLTEVGSSFAGHPYTRPLKPGECVRIMTGGEVPLNADTVTKQEIVSVLPDGKSICFPAGLRAGDNVRRQGEEIRAGDICLKQGTKLHAQHLNYLASLGISNVVVFRKPKIGFFSTGDELQPLGTPLQKGKIYDSNRYCISAMLRESGYEINDYGIIEDNFEALQNCVLKASRECDCVITSGGVSVGEADFTRKVVTQNGSLVDWHCLIKPGKPLAIGKVGDAYFFGLPGNPTAAQVTFYAIVSIGLRRLSGETSPKLIFSLARAKGKFKKRSGYTDFQRGILEFSEGTVTVQAAGSQKTGALRSMVDANCFICFEDEKEAPREGELVPVIPFYGACS